MFWIILLITIVLLGASLGVIKESQRENIIVITACIFAVTGVCALLCGIYTNSLPDSYFTEASSTAYNLQPISENYYLAMGIDSLGDVKYFYAIDINETPTIINTYLRNINIIHDTSKGLRVTTSTYILANPILRSIFWASKDKTTFYVSEDNIAPHTFNYNF